MFAAEALLLLLATHSVAQLSLPSPPYLPPPASSGVAPASASASASASPSPNPQWSTLLGNVLYFYDAQRSGKLPSTNRVSWRNDSALGDGQDAGIDLSGGYFDAGDYVKCTLPLSFTLMSICWGAIDFGAGYDNANQTPYLDSTLRWGLDWLINAHPHPHTLFVQVADSQTDTDYWGGDQTIPGPRPSFQINDTSPGTDAAAQASAAFSACSLLYSQQHLTNASSPASLTNASYAQTLLTHSVQLYDFALNATGGQRTYQTSVPQVAQAYPSTAFDDELVLAALFLSLASPNATSGTNFTGLPAPSDLYAQAQDFWTQYSLAGQDGVFNWDDKTPALAVLFSQIAALRPDLQQGQNNNMNLTSWKNEAERYFDNVVENKGPAILTKGGLLWYDGESDDASLNPALNAAMLMAHYAPLASTTDKMTAYQTFIKGQMDYALGKNPMSAPYVVGSNPNSPSNPHSALASGGDDIGAIDTSPPQEAYVLYGGVVGGPDRDDQFWDIRSDWPQTEIALDYVAPMLSLVAYNVLTNTDDPYFTSLQPGEYAKRRPSGQPCDAAFPCQSWGSLPRTDQIVIGVIIGMVGLILVVCALYWVTLCFKSKQ
ncbi:glycoside hydrolase family 9 protein [Ramaria rubella]|nr:glycoside hydrolase family 9 protein [Ramaria rubella]